jgi:predicted PurR-regulated permease PerM
MNPKNHLIAAGVLFMFLVTAQHWFEPVLDGYLIFFLITYVFSFLEKVGNRRTCGSGF